MGRKKTTLFCCTDFLEKKCKKKQKKRGGFHRCRFVSGVFVLFFGEKIGEFVAAGLFGDFFSKSL